MRATGDPKPIKEGDRGPAVEDVQRRLIALDIDIGPTGVDGVFMGRTHAAVKEFQQRQGVTEDGVVGPETWAALVDATFTLGDRLLYLRFPYLHGRDVVTLQRIFNTLGFSCGDDDGIFGTSTERAVREFQQNVGHPSDGIAGGETVKALMNLRHVWEGREAQAPVVRTAEPARAVEVLAEVEVHVLWRGETGRDVAGRLANLALAADPDATFDVREAPQGSLRVQGLTLVLTDGPGADRRGVPMVVVDEESAEPLTARLVTALRTDRPEDVPVVVDLSQAVGGDERFLQALAVGLLDGLCAGLS